MNAKAAVVMHRCAQKFALPRNATKLVMCNNCMLVVWNNPSNKRVLCVPSKGIASSFNSLYNKLISLAMV